MSPSLESILRKYLILLHTGKVRNTYAIPGFEDCQLVVATDRVSTYDFVLPILIPGKGQILTALNIFWRRIITRHLHDLLGYGADIDRWLPIRLRNIPELQKCAVIVQKLDMIKVECIARGYLTGSGWKDYKVGKPVSGHVLPEGLYDGAQLPNPIFTPSTKAEIGHDEPISYEDVKNEYGEELERKTLDIYQQGKTYAANRGVIIADTKFEFGRDPQNRNQIFLADEVLTPDSSRFWPAEDLELARTQGRTPFSFDKQYVRDEAEKLGINKRKPENPDDRAWVSKQVFRGSVIEETQHRYNEVFRLLTGKTLAEFQRDDMHINV